MPAFVFARRHDIELEADFILAGMLIVNLPREVKKLTEDQQQMVAAIIRQLMDAAQSGRMAADALVCGWHGGRRPPNAVDISNDEVMAAWARDCLTIGIRIDPQNDGQLYIDSDIMRQLNLSDAPSGKGETMSCPICIGEGGDEAERLQAEGHIRIPVGDGADPVWFICDQHKVRWRVDYRRESWTPDLSNDDERAPHERGWTLGQLCEHRTALLSRYREVEPYEAKRHLVEIPDRFAVARWSRDADVATIARCILGTLKYEPHSTDVMALRRALESVIEAETGARR